MAGSFCGPAGRQGLFFIPAILFLPPAIGITGIETSQAIADFLTFLLASGMILDVLKELKQMRESVETGQHKSAV